MSESSRQETLRDANKWDVMITTGTLFPEIEPQTIRNIRTPVFLLSGAKSYPFLEMITREFWQLLPTCRTIVLPDACHQLWFRDLEVCRRKVVTFLECFDVY
jgi:pimeloyl-ACP methyl ester carboxylesterase